MASIILSSMASSIGNMILPGIGGRILSRYARKAGNVIDEKLGLDASSSSEPKRLENFKVQDSSYGIAIPKTYGCIKIAGNVIWVSDLIETKNKTEVSSGKGGISSVFTTTKTTYTYSINCAIAIGEGEIGGIQRIWADSDVIYENGAWTSGLVASANIYTGSVDQDVDPLLEGWIGGGLTPAYRGIAYIVIQGLQLADFGNRLPNLAFEVIPTNASATPTWLGETEPTLYHNIVTNRQDGMPPLILDGGSVSAKRMLVGGYSYVSTSYQMTFIEYDVTGDAPLEIQRTAASAITLSGVSNHSWALARGKRYVAFGIQDTGINYKYYVGVFDTESNVFGEIINTSMLAAETRQIAWIDEQHFIVTDYRDGKRGVRVYMRSGLSVIDRGFYDVWGSGTATTRVPVSFTQFRPYGEGLLYYTGDVSLKFNAFYARMLMWQNNALVVGEAFTVSSGYTFSSGSGAQVRLHQISDEEWCLFYLTTIDMHMMSFIPTDSGVTITRPWQKLVCSAFAVSTSNAPLIYGDRICVLHRSSIESYYRLSEILLGDGAFSISKNGVLAEGYEIAPSNFNAAKISSTRFLVMGNTGGSGKYLPIGIMRRRHTGDSLDEIVGDVLGRAGYAASDYDVSALSVATVDGFAIENQTTPAAILETLQTYLPFDLVEVDGQLKAVLPISPDEVTVDESETGGQKVVDPDEAASYTFSRAQQLDLPVEITVDYMDASLDYETGSQRARRMISGGSTAYEKITLPMVCTASQAKQVAENQLYALWYQRDHYRLFLSRAYSMLVPGDVLRFRALRLRVLSVAAKGGLLQVDAVSALPADFASVAQSDTSLASASTTQDSVASKLFLMDLPLLRSEDNQAGLYVAVSGLEGWKGATLWRSADGVNFTSQTSFTNAATAGVATTALANASTFYKDSASSVTVQLLQGTLSSCTDSELLAGANAALLGEEIIQFQTATLISEGLYTLSNFIRGRQGTESACSTHVVGEPFVLLASATMQFLPVQLTDRAALYHFRAVSNGGSLGFAQDYELAYSLKTIQPLAPVHIAANRASGAGSDMMIRWKRRARMNGAWVDYIDVPLDEDSEAYDVEILNGSNVIRIFSGLSQASVTYTAAQQTSDWGASVPSTFTVRVYQFSSRYGRGSASTAVL